MHPKTRQPMELPERIAPVFRPGRKLKDLINNQMHKGQDGENDSPPEESLPSFQEENKIVDIDQYL